VLAVVGVWLMLQIKVGNPVEGSNLLKESSEFNTAVRAVNAHFPGLMTLEIVFEGKEKNNRFLTNARFHRAPCSSCSAISNSRTRRRRRR
jgi:antibiotic biosynthesis monooxygenase (ABM) superfamily enzyme